MKKTKKNKYTNSLFFAIFFFSIWAILLIISIFHNIGETGIILSFSGLLLSYVSFKQFEQEHYTESLK